MSHHPSETCDRYPHLPVERRYGYVECERCGHRWIFRSVLPDGTPTQDDIDWLHHK
jgi:DNA-directed RNA polymerase subunit RPC12/RpoP